MTNRSITSKQLGDAAEMLVAAQLTLNGVPSFIAPANWPGYDIVAAPRDNKLQKISVKCRGKSAINFRPEQFDWLAIVLIKQNLYEFFIIPSGIISKNSKPNDKGIYTIRISDINNNFKKYKDNFKLIKNSRHLKNSTME